ncbi:hypothetical protein [Collinsella vaginalis]|uniref:hypothetical protein n=1 Tax=Collinsella vaginalis TaxID=1870987 RepID=UPI000A27269C|nr:hypothetical protein [Collinsella vaginalis]
MPAGAEPDIVSPELDAMVGDLLGSLLDALAEGEDPGVLLAVEDEQANRYEASFTEDSIEVCLRAAQQFVSQHAGGVASDGVGALERYAIAYLGAIEDGDGGYLDAILASFYEHGQESGYSAYLLVDGIGAGDDFTWGDPEPAGAEDPLI